MFASNLAPFDEQFEADGTGILFRKDKLGPAYRVSAADYNAARRTYRRRFWVMVGAMLAAFLPLTVLTVMLVSRYGPFGMAALLGLLVILVAMVPLHRWAWNGSTAHLEKGFAVSPARDREEHAREAMAALDWWTILIIAGGISIGPLLGMDHFPPQGWDWINVAIAALGPLFAGWLALRKLRYGRR